MKKAFTLTETIVALAIIMIISLAFFSTVTFTNNSFAKSQITKYGINEIQNVITIFNGSTSLNNFEDNLTWSYGDELKITSQNNIHTFSLLRTVKNDITFNEDLGKFEFIFKQEDNTLKLNASIIYKNNILYELPTEQHKVVV